jgi:hypothetical protein
MLDDMRQKTFELTGPLPWLRRRLGNRLSGNIVRGSVLVQRLERCLVQKIVAQGGLVEVNDAPLKDTASTLDQTDTDRPSLEPEPAETKASMQAKPKTAARKMKG